MEGGKVETNLYDYTIYWSTSAHIFDWVQSDNIKFDKYVIDVPKKTTSKL
jgi:hypothetical protein